MEFDSAPCRRCCPVGENIAAQKNVQERRLPPFGSPEDTDLSFSLIPGKRTDLFQRIAHILKRLSDTLGNTVRLLLFFERLPDALVQVLKSTNFLFHRVFLSTERQCRLENF